MWQSGTCLICKTNLPSKALWLSLSDKYFTKDGAPPKSKPDCNSGSLAFSFRARESGVGCRKDKIRKRMEHSTVGVLKTFVIVECQPSPVSNCRIESNEFTTIAKSSTFA